MNRPREASVRSAPAPAPWRAFAIYVGRVREFRRRDWAVYGAWVGMMCGLSAVTTAFVLIGRRAGAPLPAVANLVPLGAGIFTLAIAVDTIGHRTIYKEALRGAEALVHHVIIVLGVASCLLLCAAYRGGAAYATPALVVTALSFIYSFVDEVMHWRRYLGAQSDAVEMWSHVFILIGHGTMMAGWWLWYAGGYAGVDRTLTALAAGCGAGT